MQRVIADDNFQRVIEKRRRWRFTDLLTTLMREFGCASSTAQRAIQRGLDQGQLERAGRTYRPVPPQLAAVDPRLRQSTIRRLIPDRLAMLEILAEREEWTVPDLIREVRSRLRIHDVVARRNFGYARAFGYVEAVGGRWRVSGECRALIGDYGRLETAEGYRFATFLSGKPMKRFERWETNADTDV